MAENEFLLTVQHMNKSFGPTRALKDVHFELKPGEVMGLIGENGSGKSTLVSIIAGVQGHDPNDLTEMRFQGKPYLPHTPPEAADLGVCIILQEKGTFDNVTVAKNVLAGREDKYSRYGFISERRMNRDVQKVLDEIGATHIKASRLLGTLSFEDQKLVEIARAMYTRPKILIVDETTTALSRDGREILYDLIEMMKKEDRSVIFISHDIDEMMEKCDELTILRDGNNVTTLTREQFNSHDIKQYMVGREVADNFYRTDMDSACGEKVVFSFDHVVNRALHDVSFELHEGEILGFGGLEGSGLHDIGRVAFGLDEPILGRVLNAEGKPVTGPAMAMACGIGYISKNRDKEALMVSSGIKPNICVASLDKLRTGKLIFRRSEVRFADEQCKKLEVKCRDLDQYIYELSGGNKQKIALAKWIGFGADILVLDCPTRGIDIGVKEYIYGLMADMKKQGKSIIMISEELPEIIGMSDRVVILKDGVISGVFRREEELTESKLIEYMI